LLAGSSAGVKAKQPDKMAAGSLAEGGVKVFIIVLTTAFFTEAPPLVFGMSTVAYVRSVPSQLVERRVVLQGEKEREVIPSPGGDATVAISASELILLLKDL